VELLDRRPHPIMGRLVDPAWSPAALLRPGGGGDRAFLLATLAVFSGYANFVVMGYFKDISADRATGYRTFPVVFGWRAAALYGDAVAIAAAALTAGALALLGANGASLAAFAAAAALSLWSQVSMHRTRDERATGAPIANGVRALVLFCLALAAANRIHWAPLLVGYYVLFELALRLRPERGQV